MPIFTFMGSNVLRQDDDYTAHVIEQTIKTVVPMLMADRAAGITPVIAAFVNNFDFIPKHRRLGLFRVLIETVGADECLPTTLFLLVEKACETKNKKKSLASEFGSDLLKSFPLSTQLAAVDSFLRMIMFIPRDPNEVVESLPVELAGYSASKLGSLKRDCLGILASELESQSFQGAVLRIRAAGEVDNAGFSSIAEKLLLVRADSESTILLGVGLIVGIRRLIETSLEGLLASLSLPSVIDIVETFVQTNRDTGVTSKMIPIAAARLVRTPATDSACQMAISKLLPLLSDILKAGVDVDSSGVALDSIAKLSRVHGKAHVAQFEDILPVLMEHGIWSSREKTVHDTLNCLFVMMYVPRFPRG
jgi:U3 small nucleolar RNA-associated protein 10